MLNFFSEDVDFSLPRPQKTKKWLKVVSESEGYVTGDLNYVFCSDDYLLEINKEYLDHDYYTDIITFDNSEEDNQLEGDIYVSIDRVRENAATFQVDFETELRRVLVHGMLHLVGYGDSNDEEKALMREKETQHLTRF